MCVCVCVCVFVSTAPGLDVYTVMQLKEHSKWYASLLGVATGLAALLGGAFAPIRALNLCGSVDPRKGSSTLLVS